MSRSVGNLCHAAPGAGQRQVGRRPHAPPGGAVEVVELVADLDVALRLPTPQAGWIY